MLMILLSLLISGSEPCQQTPTPLSPRQETVCRQVSTKAAQAGIDPVLAVAVAYHETKFIPKVGAAGELGPLQAMPKYWCPKKGKCDPLQAGIKALGYYLRKHDTLRMALTRYNGAGPGARAYAETVLTIYAGLRNKTQFMLMFPLTKTTYPR